MSLRQIIKINNITAAMFLFLLASLLLALSLIVGALFYAQSRILSKKTTKAPAGEKTMEEIIKDLTAPAGSGEKTTASGETLESLTAPEKSGSGVQTAGQGVSKEVMDNLTAPAAK